MIGCSESAGADAEEEGGGCGVLEFFCFPVKKLRGAPLLWVGRGREKYGDIPAGEY